MSLVARIAAWMGVLSAVALVGMLIHVTLDVALRNIMDQPIPGTLETITYLWMPCIVFLALPVTEARFDHIRISWAARGGSAPVAAGPIEALVSALGTAVAAMMLYFAIGASLDSLAVGQSSQGAIAVPIWPAKIVMAVGLGMVVVQSVARTAQEVSELVRLRQPGARGRTPWIRVAALTVAVAAVAVLMLGSDSREGVGLLVLAAMLGLMVSGVPIYLAMAAASALGLLQLAGPLAAANSLRELIFGATATWSLSVIPAFVLMGVVLWRFGLTGAAFDTASRWLRNVPGGLAIGTNFAGAGLAAASGSSVAISYSLGRIALPEMLRRGYDPSLATGVVAVSGTLGQLIPPSILLVVYAGVAQTPVGPQLLAAVVPGILLALLYGLMIWVRASVRPQLAPRGAEGPFPFAERVGSLVKLLPIGIIVVIVIGGIFSGLFTATEAGAVAALVAIGIGLMRRPAEGVRRVDLVKQSVMDTVSAVGSVFALLIGVALLTRLLTMSRVTNAVTEFVATLQLPVLVFLAALVVIYLILGMFLDPMALILLTVPILAGSLDAYGIDPIWFGVFLVLLAELGLVTPPVGMLAYIVHRLAQDPEVNGGRSISLRTVFRGALWFIAVTLVLIAAIAVFPDIVLWLPGVASAP